VGLEGRSGRRWPWFEQGGAARREQVVAVGGGGGATDVGSKYGGAWKEAMVATKYEEDVS
jgi:hypothetical protein